MPKFQKKVKEEQPMQTAEQPKSDYQCTNAQNAAIAAMATKEVAKTMEAMSNAPTVKPLYAPIPHEDEAERRKRLEKIAKQMRGESLIKTIKKPLLLVFIYPLLTIGATVGAAALTALFIVAFAKMIIRFWGLS